jgi:hypothetical protein
MALAVMFLYILISTIENNLIVPADNGLRAVNISPLIAILALAADDDWQEFRSLLLAIPIILVYLCFALCASFSKEKSMRTLDHEVV